MQPDNTIVTPNAALKKARKRRRRIEKPVLTELPQAGAFQLSQFVPSVFSMGRSTWWKLVKAGKAPQPVREGFGTRWTASALREYQKSLDRAST
jgi:predicted DNA-binding transcriptional regulator AlpA